MSRKYTAAGFIAAFLLCSNGSAMGQSQASLAVKDASGATQTMCEVTSVSGATLGTCANVYKGGAPVSSINPLDVSLQSLPLPSGAATASGVTAIVNALGSPLQAGGSIGNTAFGISGSLPGFAAPPTFNLGTAPSLTIGALPALPAGSNAIGSITNTSFGIAGTLPPFAVTPIVNIGTMPTTPVTGTITANAGTNMSTAALAVETGGNLAGLNAKFTTTANGVKVDGSGVTQPVSGTVTANLGTLNGIATAALQGATNTALGSINTTLGTPLQAGGNVAVTALPALPAGANLIGLVQPAISLPTVITAGTAYNYSTYGTVREQVDSLAGGDSITFAGSVASGGTAYPLQVLSLSGTFGTTTSSITAPGTYLLLGGGGLYVTETHVGSASSPVTTASAAQ